MMVKNGYYKNNFDFRIRLTVRCNSRIITFLDFDCKTVCTFSIKASGTAEAGTIGGIREPIIRLETRPLNS